MCIRDRYIAGSELFESNEVGVKYGFMLGLKELLLKSISQFTKEKTNKQINKQRKRKKNKPVLGLT